MHTVGYNLNNVFRSLKGFPCRHQLDWRVCFVLTVIFVFLMSIRWIILYKPTLVSSVFRNNPPNNYRGAF